MSSVLKKPRLWPDGWLPHVGKTMNDTLQDGANVHAGNGKLEVDRRPGEVQNKNPGQRFQLLNCSAPQNEYAPPSPFVKQGNYTLTHAGLLATEDLSSCVTVKDGSVSMQGCTNATGDLLAAQWIYVSGEYVIHAGKTGTPKSTVPTFKGNTISSLDQVKDPNDFECLRLSIFNEHPSGRPNGQTTHRPRKWIVRSATSGIVIALALL